MSSSPIGQTRYFSRFHFYIFSVKHPVPFTNSSSLKVGGDFNLVWEELSVIYIKWTLWAFEKVYVFLYWFWMAFVILNVLSRFLWYCDCLVVLFQLFVLQNLYLSFFLLWTYIFSSTYCAVYLHFRSINVLKPYLFLDIV